MGNIYARLPGASAAAGTVATGSHCDAIPLAGMYDGTLGVLGGIMALDAVAHLVRVPVVQSFCATCYSDGRIEHVVHTHSNRAQRHIMCPSVLVVIAVPIAKYWHHQRALYVHISAGHQAAKECRGHYVHVRGAH